ncbi:NADH:ubiquinone oxidoreductase subunit J [Candidatus Thiomargarita nelsonii]|uniref:NADH-quinone oxidoreductase subunit J n=1 Tax=Candidatus Thiomargarita nelsonii TaxID=1003181 RepID=A0A0A6P7D1_9GAMM|nr:NADH:ubiquinone oxidoreductase subunit J [Candidatus Thiomargarita nelsonii]
MIKFTFYLFALILIFAASRVITVRNPIHAALFLVLAFFSSAAIWLLLHAEFLAIVLILVYVGAVMVLFLFVLMMLDINVAPLREGFVRYLPVAAFVGVLILVEMILVLVGWHQAPPPEVAAALPNTKALGLVLYTDYVYPFEIAAAILLVAMIAAIALTMRPHTRAKYQKPEEQVRVRREDRVRLVKMPSESKE